MDAETESLSQIEIELAVLARTLESMSRRSEIHRELDRSSYLLARTLAAEGPTSINGLARKLGLDATTVTRQVATMDRAGLVHRRADSRDARVSLIELSPAGRRRMEQVQAAREARVAELLAEWSERDRVQLGRQLQRFNDALLDRGDRRGEDQRGAAARRSS